MFIFQNNRYGINATCECLQNDFVLMDLKIISAKLFLPRRKQKNIEHRTSNIEHWMGKDEETDIWSERKVDHFSKVSKPERMNDILQETEELIKIFVSSIRTADKKKE